MHSYTPAVESGSVVGDYSSRAYNGVYDLLSNLKGRAASYLSKFLYHVNIAGRLEEFERMIEEATVRQSQQVDELSDQINALNKGQLTTLRKVVGMIGEIADSTDRVEELRKKMPVLEQLLSTSPKE